LTDKLIKYVPEANNHNKDIITIKNLLLHNAGLCSGYPYRAVNVTKSEIINWCYNCELVYPVGTNFIYSDISMVFL